MQIAETLSRAKTQLTPVSERFLALGVDLGQNLRDHIAHLQRLAHTHKVPANPTPRLNYRQHSMNLAVLFSALGSKGRVNSGLKVLDLGPQNAHTQAYLERYECELVNADLLGALGQPHIDAQHYSDTAKSDLGEAMQRQLSQAAGTGYDVCLLWDIPHYLDAEALQLLGHALGAVLQQECLAHGFCAHTHRVDLPAARYGIHQTTQIQVDAADDNRGPRHAHTAADFKSWLPQLNIRRGTLLQDGRIEALLSVADLNQ